MIVTATQRQSQGTLTKLDEKPLPLELVTAGEETQMRYATRAETIGEYAELFDSADGWPFDTKLIVFKDATGVHWLADGFHRYRAAKRVGRSSVHCIIYEGELSDAQDYALSANASHGLRRTNEDKRKAVGAALAMERWAMQSDRAIAEHVGVGRELVGKIRKQLSVTDSWTDPETRIGRDGRARKLPTPTAEPVVSVATAAPAPETTTPFENQLSVTDSWTPEPDTPHPEQPEVVQRVQAALRSHFNEDELPTEESHCKAIASCDEDVWRDVVEMARERAAMRDSDPKIQDFRDAAKEQSWQHQRKLADKFGVLAMQSMDELHNIKRNHTRHGTAMKLIQAFLNELKGWN